VTSVDLIHARISGETWRYERAATLALETALLIACALPAVHDLRSGAIAAVTGLLRLYQAETAREKASIEGRHRERHAAPPYPPRKQALIDALAWREQLVTWAWPALIVLVAADSWGWPAATALFATLARAAWAKLAFPAWRRSRAAWRATQ
jgi:hypothetical protein